jgi:NAD(P)H-hydrate epimerase
MHRILSRDQIRSFDRFAIEDCRVPGLILMENAGRGAAEVIRTLLDDVEHTVVVCGTGNNGGDGFVVARHLTSFGASVSVCLLGDPGKLKGDALANHDAFLGLGGRVTIVEDDATMPVFETELLRAGLIVDAIFGTGLDREIDGRYAEVIDRINATPATRVALDLPSGLDANTGSVLGTVVVADVTITFGALKLGLLTPMGTRLAGDVHVANLGVPSTILERTGHDAEVLVGSRIQQMVERIRTQARIIDDGAVGIVVCGEDEAWALRLAMQAALRTAPGKVKLMAPAKMLWDLRGLASNARLEEIDPKQAKGFAMAWEDCDTLVFPAATEADAALIKQARKSFDGSIVLGMSRNRGKVKSLRSKGGDVAIVCDLQGLGALLDADEESVASDRFGSVREASELTESTLVLADTQPVIGVPGTALGVFGRRIDALDSDGIRAVCCGAIGRLACWSEASVASLGGLHLTAASVDRWLEDHKGRGGPLAEEVADGIPLAL